MKYVWLVYLQILFVMGANRGRSWVDNQILLCYNELDKVINDDPSHPHTNAKDALMAAVEGKLPIVKADGTLKPIELTFTLKYDPTTGSIDIDKS